MSKLIVGIFQCLAKVLCWAIKSILGLFMAIFKGVLVLFGFNPKEPYLVQRMIVFSLIAGFIWYVPISVTFVKFPTFFLEQGAKIAYHANGAKNDAVNAVKTMVPDYVYKSHAGNASLSIFETGRAVFDNDSVPLRHKVASRALYGGIK